MWVQEWDRLVIWHKSSRSSPFFQNVISRRVLRIKQYPWKPRSECLSLTRIWFFLPSEQSCSRKPTSSIGKKSQCYKKTMLFSRQQRVVNPSELRILRRERKYFHPKTSRVVIETPKYANLASNHQLKSHHRRLENRNFIIEIYVFHPEKCVIELFGELKSSLRSISGGFCCIFTF